MKTIYDVEKLVKEYMVRHGYEMKSNMRIGNKYEVETTDYTTLTATLNNNRITFKVDGKRASLTK